MVTMVSGKPMTAMERGRAAGGRRALSNARGRSRGPADAGAGALWRPACRRSPSARSPLRSRPRRRPRTPGIGPQPGRYAAKVEVRPGQSLWSLAEAYDPDADPRLVVQQIQQLNSMTGDQVQPGEVLWMPRG